jgi:thiol reductant ABC exporter CydD subunit
MRGVRRRPLSVDGRLLAYVPAARRLLWFAVACGFVAATTVIASGLLLSLVIAAVFVESRPPDAIVPLIVALVLLAACRAGLLFSSELLAQRAASRLKSQLRRDVTARLFELGPARVSAERSGDLASTLVNGLEALDAWMTSYLPARSLAAAVPFLVLAVVLVLDPPTALVLVFAGPVLVLLLAVIGSRTRAISERRFAELRWMSAYFVDMLRGIATLKAFGRSGEQVATMRAISRQFGETTLEVLRSAFQTGLVLDWAGAVAMALVAVEVSLRLMVAEISFERALAVLVITPEFFLPLRTLAQRYHAGSAGHAAAGRLFAILDTPSPHVPVAMRTTDLPAGAGQGSVPRPPAIALDRVSYRYPERDHRALDDVTFAVPAGGRLTIVGPSGAGKSTLAALLLRFLEPDEGRILVGGGDLTDVEPGAWRAAVGYVPQSPRLFHGTIADNLRLARPAATTRELNDTIRLSGADEIIADLPGGLDTGVGEGGTRLSGGQRQRLAIARALLRDPGVLLLDEPTAHLDTTGEETIVALLDQLAGARTIVAISHRPRLALTSDLVAVLDGGHLVELGPPAELQRSGGAFAELLAAWSADDGSVGEAQRGPAWMGGPLAGESVG